MANFYIGIIDLITIVLTHWIIGCFDSAWSTLSMQQKWKSAPSSNAEGIDNDTKPTLLIHIGVTNIKEFISHHLIRAQTFSASIAHVRG